MSTGIETPEAMGKRMYEMSDAFCDLNREGIAVAVARERDKQIAAAMLADADKIGRDVVGASDIEQIVGLAQAATLRVFAHGLIGGTT